MTQQLSPRDWEYLSLYLDRQLKPKEVASLEARLSADPELSAALGELQRTRDALRSLPRMRAPRNFTLTPQMVGQRSTVRPRSAGRLAPVFGFASALATFILVLVIIGDMLGILTPTTKPVTQAPTRASEVSLQVAATAALENQTAPIQGESPQPTVVANLIPQVQESPRTLTVTAPMSLTVGAILQSTQAEDTPTVGAPTESSLTLSETMIASETMTATAKMAAGKGGGEPAETGDYASLPGNVTSSEGPMWVTNVQVFVSPTETLNFPMTITLDVPPVAESYNAAADTGLPTETLLQAEPTLTAAPVQPPAPSESTVPAPANTPETVARIVETPSPSKTEPQTYQPVQIPSQTLTPLASNPQPARSGRSAVRILEITLTLLALATGLAAAFFWWRKRL